MFPFCFPPFITHSPLHMMEKLSSSLLSCFHLFFMSREEIREMSSKMPIEV